VEADSQRISDHEIERPRSALHAGNFDEPVGSHKTLDSYGSSRIPLHAVDAVPIATSPSTPWQRPSHIRSSPVHDLQAEDPRSSPIDVDRRPVRSRAPSLQSYSSSFVLKPPTSPLVQEANNDDLDFNATTLHRPDCRHALPADSLQSSRSLGGGLARAARKPPSFHQEHTFPATTPSHHRRSLGAMLPHQTSYSPPAAQSYTTPRV
jgi:hypothetical protein